MAEKGESLPERCDNCREKHSQQLKEEIKCPYFQIDLQTPGLVFDFYQSLYTSHGERPRVPAEVKPEGEMKVRLTDEHVKELYRKLQKNQVVVLTSPTGTGKSTYLLYRLIEAVQDYPGDFVERLLHQGQIIQTQPLTSAVDRIPNTVSQKKLGESGVGKLRALGIRHRGRPDYDRHNLAVVVTDGSLRNWVRDGYLGQYSLIMIDEAHKRTLNIDEILLFLKHKLPLYPHLRVVIASATIDISEFKEAFSAEGISVDVFDLSEILGEQINYKLHFWNKEPFVDCDCWFCQNGIKEKKLGEDRDPPTETQLAEEIASLVVEILKKTDTGGVLAFLPGEAIIENTKVLIEQRKKDIDPAGKIPIIPIYSRLREEEVEKRFNQQGEKRRVLLTTDIAETSHTLEDLIYVIDSGYVKESQWDPETCTASLPIVRCSQARCKQRWGRVGRVQKGYVYCLYTQSQFQDDKEFCGQTPPEIFRSPLEDVILNLKAAGIRDVDSTFLIGSTKDKKEVESEITRSLKAIKDQGFVDENGNVTEKGIELFYLPLTASDKALLDLADEQNCLVEMATALSMIKTDEGEARTGAGLYNPWNGLLIWDSRWTARTKREVWRIHQALRVGCSDDLDFIAKLLICFTSAEQRGLGKAWAERHFINQAVLREVLAQRDSLVGIYRIKTQEKDVRGIHLELLDKVRSLMAAVLIDRIAQLKAGNPVLYQIGDTSGVISEYCAGNWLKQEKAIVVMSVKEKRILNGRLKVVPVTSFVVRCPDKSGVTRRKTLLIDQRFPIGSYVSVQEREGTYVISDITRLPLPIDVDYKMRVTFGMLLEDFLRVDCPPTVYFPENLLSDEVKQLTPQAEANWIGQENYTKEAQIIEWIELDGFPRALIAPINELPLLAKLRSEKKEGDQLEVQIEKVMRDPDGKRGWILSRTRDGLEIPLELRDISIGLWEPFRIFGYSLKQLEGSWIQLAIKDFDLMGRPRLSNLEKVISDLKKIRTEIEKGNSIVEAYVEMVNEEEKKIVVAYPHGSGIIHFFDIWVPREWKISSFEIGEKLALTLSFKKEEKGYRYHPLLDYQIKSLPAGLEYEPGGKIVFQYFLNDGDFERWEAPEEIIEDVFRSSWHFALQARIIPLRLGEFVRGRVTEIMRHSEKGYISGVKVAIESEKFFLTGFVPFSKLQRIWDRATRSKLIPRVGDVINLEVVSQRGRNLIFRQRVD